MDSMRSLNTSLPNTRRQPDVHQAFRTAALNVTNLYKSALADMEHARTDGYQEALDDLLALLDRENMGVGDGEGWRIRQWATERLAGTQPKQSSSDSDEEYTDERRARSSSPVMQGNPGSDDTRAADETINLAPRCDSAPPPVHMEASTTEADLSPLHHVFQFTAPHTPTSGSATDNYTSADVSAAARRAFSSPRRSSNRSSSRSLQRSAAQNVLQLGSGAGQKRRLMNDVFNLDGFNDHRRDGSSGGGSKRGRMT